MTRHARNCTAGAVYTYHEKKKDAAASGYGTQSERVGKDSVKNFDDCSLTLQPCRNPVITKEGYLFDKEAILEYVISKKTEYTRKLKRYEQQLKKEENEKHELAAAEKEANLIKFMNREKNISSSTPKNTESGPSSSNSVSNLANGKDKHLPSFWVPAMLPDAKISKVDKPDPTVYCPISGKSLKMKDLIEVKWTLVPDPDDKKSLIAKENRYMCPVTHDILSNAIPCAVIRSDSEYSAPARTPSPELRKKSPKNLKKRKATPTPRSEFDFINQQRRTPSPSPVVKKRNPSSKGCASGSKSKKSDSRTTGHVVTMECVENLIKKDWVHPLTGEKLKEKDIIPLQRGGTGYALTNHNLESKNERPVLQA